MAIPRFLISSLILLSSALQAEPLHWLATKNGTEILMIGSVHVGAEDMYPLPPSVANYLSHSDGLIIEADVRNTEGIIYPTNQKQTREVISAQQKTQLNDIARELQINQHNLLASPPWATAITLQMAQMNRLGFSPEDGVDQRLIELANQNRQPILPLETLQFQIDMLTRMPDDGKELLEETLSEWHRGKAITQCLIQSWKTGDRDNLQIFSELSEMSSDMAEQLLVRRNKDWADKLNGHQFLPKKQGHYVMVVGMLHLLGPDNVRALLQEKGFTVRQLSDSRPADCQFPNI